LNKKLESLKDSVNALNHTLDQAPAESKAGVQEAIRELTREYNSIDSVKQHVVKRKTRSNWSLSFGLAGVPGTSIQAKRSKLAERYDLYTQFGDLFVVDTVENSSQTGTLELPAGAGLGVTLKQGSRWLIGADYSMQNWKKYSGFDAGDSLGNSWKLSAGAQFTPNDRSIKSYFSNVQYRLGFHYEQTYLQLRNNQLKEYGISAGLGMPVRRSGAMLHFAVEAGKRGTVDSNLIQENFLRISIGFTLNDLWFIKRNYD